MFGWFNNSSKQPTSPIEATLKRSLIYYDACKMFLDNREPVPSEKFQLAANLYFLGAVDCASQVSKLSDIQFGELAQCFFSKIGITGYELSTSYVSILLMFFLKMNTNTAAMHCIVEGGHSFNEWMKGNKAIPMTVRSSIKRFEENPEFPETIGHLYVKVEKEKNNGDGQLFNRGF
ncbi:MAG: hypothetical protein KJ661_07425 [Candidatus Omnitrophica bacterium]|nr:hypothetical protein [Candidatus Omnitrophota bacterium]